MAPGDLQEVLEALKPMGRAQPDLLVGLGAADDAAVYRITADVAIVATVDFFPPVVDDPWTWGAISATNSMSDVFAMGGEVLFALAVAGFPREMSKAIIAEVFRGGSDKIAEAGGVIAGGHTVVDAEPKYGLCVTGRVHPDRILIKGGLRAGDRLFLSKPLGTGVITTAAKDGAVSAAVLEGAVASMLRLNRVAAEVAREAGARGATDVTGFGLLGHAGEMVKASGVGIAIGAPRLPLLPGTRELAEAGNQPFLQLGRDVDLTELAGGVDRPAVGVNEGDARGAALDVPLQQLERLSGKGSLEILAQELGDLPTLDR